MDQKTSRYAIIKDMLKAAFKIDKPRDWQMDIIYQLCYETSTSLCVQKTGGGKSLLVLGTMALLRGVAIVIEPLKSIGTDQAASARASCPAACMRTMSTTLLRKRRRWLLRLRSLQQGTKSAIILYMSPQSLVPTAPGASYCPPPAPVLGPSRGFRRGRFGA